VQLYYLGWNADYPDPENFLFLLAGTEGKVAKGGENASNYANPEFDRLFEQMKNMESDGPRGVETPGDHPPGDHAAAARCAVDLRLSSEELYAGHVWLHNRKPTEVGNNILKYQRIDVAERQRLRQEWNRPVLWPLAAAAALLVAVILPAAIAYRRRERSTAR
jgi:oligopeptide transport system substrate-binding protein